MTRPIDIIKIKELRGQLLVNLNLFYPSPVRLDTLFRTICGNPAYNESLFQKDVSYFFQKRYFESIDDRLGGSDNWWHKVVTLTALGKEIAEGTRTDEALTI
jgi:hypothetical protein